MNRHAFWCPLETRGGTCTCQLTALKGPAMTPPDHAELAEKALAAAMAALDSMHPDPAELALCAAAHWLGAIHDTLKQNRAWDIVEQDQSARFERSPDPHAVDPEDPEIDEDNQDSLLGDTVPRPAHTAEDARYSRETALLRDDT